MDKTKVTPQEFKGVVKRLSKATYKTSFVPRKVSDALRKSGASQFSWRSVSKRQFLDTIENLQEQGVVKVKKELAPKRVYQGIIQERESTDVGNDVLLASGELPGMLSAREFIKYYGEANGKPGDIKAVLQSLGLPTGAANPRTGAEPHLTKGQMARALAKARELGKLTHPNIGKEIKRIARRTEIFREEGRHSEEEDQMQRYQAAAHEDLPEGIRRSIGRPASESALRAGARLQRTSSAGRAGREQSDPEVEGHATTASALARRARPDDPKSSVTRMGKGSRGNAPELTDLPFDID